MQTKEKDADIQEVSLKTAVSNTLDEARMILPGLQALFGFQMIAIFNAGFDAIDRLDKIVHWVALIFTVIAMALLMTPAAYDRETGTRFISGHFVRLSTRMIAAALVPLSISLSLDTYVVTNLIFHRADLALLAGLLVVCLLGYLWFILPIFDGKKCRPNREY